MASGKDYVGIGIIGAGFARTTQIPGFRACAGARVVSIASAHRERAAAVAQEFDIPHVADDWRGVIERADVDLVSIVTPPATHLEMTLAALDAGKAVLCEKPMAMNAAEAKRMHLRALEKNALALIDHELRFLNGRQKMREMLLSGEIGEVWHAKLVFRADSRTKPEVAWNWWSDEKMGGGALGAIGSHAIDAFRWLFDAEVAEVFCSLQTHVKQRPADNGEMRDVTTDDEANLILRFTNTPLTKSTTANVSLSVVESGEAKHRLEIFGSRGALKVEERGELWHSQTGTGKWTPVDVELGHVADGMGDKGWQRGFVEFARRIVEALREERHTIEGAAAFDDGYHTQLVLDAARRSHESGCWVAPDKSA